MEESPNSVFDESFSDETRQALIDEDSLAWKRVCGLLLTIVVGGLLLGSLGVYLSR